MNAAPALDSQFHSSSTTLGDAARYYGPRIRRHAARYARKLPRHLALGDLVSAGYRGLVDAYARYDRERSSSFEAYLDHRIRGAILDELRQVDPLTRDQRIFARNHSAAVQRLSQRLGRAPHEAEVAKELELSVASMREMQSRVNESTMRGAAVSESEVLDGAPDDDRARPDVMLESRERRACVLAALTRLPERHRMALRMYYEEDQTLRSIAGVLGVTESRVSQIHSEAIAKLRGMLSDA